MASEEEAGAPAEVIPLSFSSSASPGGVSGLDALFPAGEESPELRRLRESLQALLGRYEPLVLWLQRLLVWERPLHSILLACALNGVFWLLSSTPLRPFFLLSLSMLGIVLMERWKHNLLPIIIAQPQEDSAQERESVVDHPQLLSVPELCHHLAESYLTFNLYAQEMIQYKRQNPGKFCAFVCAGCSLFAVTGHYIPGIMISYIILLSVLLWPLVVYHELIQKMYTALEPVLMKLDYSMKGGAQHRKHEKKKIKKEPEGEDEPMAETESDSEEELSCFSPTVDVKTTALALAITDSELSDEEASILESGGFSVSRATTPQLTDVSEDLDQQSINSEPEETFSKDLPEFPSMDEYVSNEQGCVQTVCGKEEEEDRTDGGIGVPLHPHIDEPSDSESTVASFLVQRLASPLHFVNTHFNGHSRPVEGEYQQVGSTGLGLTLEALSEEIVSNAISAVVQNTLSALLRSSEDSEGPSIAEFLPQESQENLLSHMSETELKREKEATSIEEEDFELLDQKELEQMDTELELYVHNNPAEQELSFDNNALDQVSKGKEC
ncbi:reticulophagy regulator 2 [Erpetoichthys calabaricus]|uniref:Reticulophagy regulator family member 2 n=1 Tax=Erpetoichthys calabaricus TaxID=27687 RepID=A0A8C4TA92_ERPCA|nr:reticulophagy regulator 2 [Erpetoichthys calabaricus]